MDLSTYIEQLGDEEAAKRFGVAVRTVASWRRRERKPRPAKAQKIIKAAKGELTFESIYSATQRSQKSLTQ